MPDPIRKAVAASMLLAPVLGLVSAVAAPPLRSTSAGTIAEIARHQDRWYVYALFVTASMWLFVVAVLGLIGLVAGRAPRLGVAAGALALLGTLVATGDGTAELVYWQMGAPGADRAQMTALAERYENAAGSSLLFTVGGLALIVGLAVLGVALWRLRLAPTWAALGAPAAAIVNIVGFGASSNVLVVVSNVLLLAAFAGLARCLPAGGREPVLNRGPLHVPAGAR